MSSKKRNTKAQSDDGLLAPGEKDTLEVTRRSDEKVGKTLARITLDPQTRNASLASWFGSQSFCDQMKPDLAQTSAVLGEEIGKTLNGDLSLASRLYTSHAISLDTLVTELARRSGENLGQYPQAAERYMRLALKAQLACRSTLDALAKLHQPREQTVRHVHVNEGGQAVIADQFHHHTGGSKNGNSNEQPHATGTAGESAALPCPDAGGNRVPIPSREGQPAMQDARRQGKRGT